MAFEKTDKQALLEWEEFLESIRNSTPVDHNESEADKVKRMKRLEADPEAWFAYYFPKFASAKPAPFHIKSTKKVLSTPRLYHRRAWARGLAKSTRRMFEMFFKMLAQKKRVNCLLISKTETNATRLLAPYRGNLEANERIIHDYGVQVKPGKWREEEFLTRTGSAFRAVGAEQNPRGARLDELRITDVIFDDVDDDEVCRNEDRLNARWEWIEKAVIPTVDIANDYMIAVDNNIIAEDSIAVRAAEYANLVELVNIRDENGKSVWDKNSEQDIDDILSRISYESAQGEYFNNPLTQGKTFTNFTFGKCPPIKSLPFIITYADPSPSNRDRPSKKSRANNSCKAVVIIGYKHPNFYLYKCWVDNTTNSNFIDWLFAAKHYVGSDTQPYFFIENNTLQNPFYEQVLLPLIWQKGKEHQTDLPITPDTTTKPDKWFRIEGTLEPLFRMGNFIFNEAEKDNDHMKRMVAQFKSASPNSSTLDGPDAVQGAVKIAKDKTAIASVGNIKTFKRERNSNYY